MDPFTLIVTALAAGAALRITDTASTGVKDAYADLKALVRKRLGGRQDAGLVLARHEQAPETWREPLMTELAEAGADRDRDQTAATRALLDLTGEAGGQTAKYTVDARGVCGMQIGDGNRQKNVFNPRRAAKAPEMIARTGLGQRRAQTAAPDRHCVELIDHDIQDNGDHWPLRPIGPGHIRYDDFLRVRLDPLTA